MAEELPELIGRHVDVLEKSRANIPLIADAYDITKDCPLRNRRNRVILLFHAITPRFPELTIELVDCHLDDIRGYSYTLSVPALRNKTCDDFKILTFLAKRFGLETENLLELIERLV